MTVRHEVPQDRRALQGRPLTPPREGASRRGDARRIGARLSRSESSRGRVGSRRPAPHAYSQCITCAPPVQQVTDPFAGASLRPGSKKSQLTISPAGDELTRQEHQSEGF